MEHIKENGNGSREKLYITHVTVRESLYILVAKVFIIECIVAAFLLASCTPYACITDATIKQFLIVASSLFKLGLTGFILYQWLNDYYEISPTRIVHISGFLYQARTDIRISHISSAGIEQGLLGRLCNFGTIKLFNRESKDYYYLFQIHNPNKYFQLINRMNEGLDEDSHTVREHLVGKEHSF